MPASDTLNSFTALVPSDRTSEVSPAAKWPAPAIIESARARTERHLSEAFKPCLSCSRSALSLNAGNRLEYVPAIVRGIITHYVEPEVRIRLKEPADNLRLIEDLGLDSLSMMEIMIKVEDLLQVRVSDEELRHFRTLGDFRLFIDRAVRSAPAIDATPLPAT